MKVQSKNNIFFYFGNAQEEIDAVAQKLRVQALVLLDQTHGINGHVITEYNCHMPAKSAEGDFLVTDLAHIGLGVVTADCLPIIFVDSVHNAIGIAHVGWCGSVQNIVGETLQCMKKNYGTTVQDVSVFLGPCAHVCCYKVQEDFIAHVAPFSFSSDAIAQRDNAFFFDLLYFNKQILLSLGIAPGSLNDQYSCCTICNENYFSYRRQGDKAGRQVSVVSIRGKELKNEIYSSNSSRYP